MASWVAEWEGGTEGAIKQGKARFSQVRETQMPILVNIKFAKMKY